MLQKFNEALIRAVCEHAPERVNPAQLLSERLNLGREAAYRRLRGEVPFSFGEAARLASVLDFSLDELAASEHAGNVLFRLKFIDFHSPITLYNELLERDIRFFHNMTSDSSAMLAMAGNVIPTEMYLQFEEMAKFRLYKWLYQHDATGPGVRTFEDLKLPEGLLSNFKEYVRSAQSLATTHFVFDNSGIKHWIHALRAFRAMHLLSQESLERIRGEMYAILEYLERIAAAGEYPNGNKVFLYLSDIDLEATYSYVEASKFRFAGIGIFSLNALRTSDDKMFDYVKQWIRTQSRFATLISRSVERNRLLFFKRQRDFLSELE